MDTNLDDALRQLLARLADVAEARRTGKPIDITARHWRGFYALASDVNTVVEGVARVRQWTETQARKRR